jgi:cob(I)alamin adenosyltransferase
MPRITKVTTRRGDGGQTSLGSRERVPKDALRVRAYGTVDELNSAIGLALALGANATLAPMLGGIQNDLLDVGADLAMPPRPNEDAARRLAAADVARLETDAAGLLSGLDQLQNFVLPGGSPASAALHLARTICRRAEREVVSLAREEATNPEVLRYLNRLSDLLFIMARVEGRSNGAPEPVWQPRARSSHANATPQAG